MSDAINLYDSKIKTLLSRKDILANILIRAIDEFEDCPLEKAIMLIDDKSIETGSSNVDDLSRGTLIHSYDTNDVSRKDGDRNYDVKFRVKTPVDTEIYINLEAQKNAHPGYILERRGIYYLSRLISSQYKIEFENSDFNKLKKVYSIWVCANTSTIKRSNSIVRYSMKPELVFGSQKAIAKESDYNLVNLIMIFLNSNSDVENELIRMFKLLLHDLCDESKHLSALNALGKEYGIYDLEKEANEMCDFGVSIFEDGFKNGFEDGFDKGAKQANKKFILTLHKKGYTEEEIAEDFKIDYEYVCECVKQYKNETSTYNIPYPSITTNDEDKLQNEFGSLDNPI